MKNCNYYSKEEDHRFSLLILQFNKLQDGSEEKESKRALLRDRTLILIYQLSIRNLFLTADEAAEVYLAYREDVDRIIASYTISKVSYNTYLTQVCRYKAMTLSKIQYTKARLEEGYTYSLQLNYDDEELEFFQRSSYSGTVRPEIFDLDIKGLISFIMENKDEKIDESLSPKEKKLADILYFTKNRRHMMILLLSLPQLENTEFIEGLARVMQLDPMVFSYFYTLRYELLSEINKRWEEVKTKANRHYKTLITLRGKLSFETDKEKKDELEEAYQRIYGHYVKTMEEAKRRKRGLTQIEIAKALSIKRSSVCYSMKQIKRLLNEIYIKEESLIAL